MLSLRTNEVEQHFVFWKYSDNFLFFLHCFAWLFVDDENVAQDSAHWAHVPSTTEHTPSLAIIFFFSQSDFISCYIMILGPGVGTIMYSGPPLLLEKDRGQRRSETEPRQIFPGNVPSARRSSQAETQDMGQRDSYTRGYHWHTETLPHFAFVAFS